MRTRVTAAALSGLLALALSGLLALALAGCTTPEPEPTPTSAFSSEDEAFAAAEETYRAYVDALNQVDLSDPETFEAVYSWTTDDLNATDRKSFSQWHADGFSKTGAAMIISFEPQSYASSPQRQVLVGACLDISTVDILDASGNSVVSPDRPPVQSLTVTFVEADSSPTSFRVASLDPGDDDAC
ncbi:hypothetical protein ACWKWN_09040 [Microbacterium trichothecenolyticum]